MPTDMCDVSGCYEPVESSDFACSEHMLEFEDGDLDQCFDCDGLKYVDEPVCVDCAPGIADDPESDETGSATPGSILAWEPEPEEDGLTELDGTGG